MDAMELEFVQPPRSRGAFVLVLLILAAFTFSYLAAFALPEVLASSDLMPRWEPGHDPRPHWMAVAFVASTLFIFAVGTVTRILNWRQFRQIDAMAEA
jgi:hypothetical protein